MYLNQAFTMYMLHNLFYAERRRNIIEVINECIILLTVYHLFCLTDFVTDVETRANFVGLTMIGVTFLNLGVNLLPLTYEALKTLLIKLRKAYAKLKIKVKKR